MRAADFDYELPPELIAKYPAAKRPGSRLMVVDAAGGNLLDRQFEDLPGFLRSGDLLVFNDTRVINARLKGKKPSGGRVEILLERILSSRTAIAKVRAGKKTGPGSRIRLPEGIVAEAT